MWLHQRSAIPSDRSRMRKGADKRRRDAATARPEGPAPMIMGPGMTEAVGVGLVWIVVLVGAME